MKMVSAKLKMLTVKVYITASVMTMVLMQTKDGCMGIGFIRLGYGIFGHEVRATKRSPPYSLTRWIITQSKGFTKKGIEKISRSMMAYVYLVLTSQVQARTSIADNSAPTVDAQ